MNNAIALIAKHQSNIHNQASLQTNWQQDELHPVALIPKETMASQDFYIYFLLNRRLKDSRNIISGNLLQICNRLGLKHSANDSAVHY